MFKNVNILMVDDRLDGLLAMEAVLSSEEYNLIKASSGREALEYIQQYEFAVILLDVQMPIMDGLETAKLIRLDPLSKETPIIFVTAIDLNSQRVYKGYESGAVDYIFKPLDDLILRAKIKVFVDLYKKNQRIREQAALLREVELRKKDRLREELELENLRRYANLANAIPHIVFKTTEDGKLEYLNKIWYEEYSPNNFEVRKFHWEDMVNPDDRWKIIRQWLNKEPKSSFQVEARIKCKEGSYRWHLIRMVRENKDDKVIGWLGTCTDIHEQKNTENEFKLLTENLNRSNKDLEEFAYVASHDLQEPLRKIITFTEIIYGNLNGMANEDKELFDRIYRAGFRMKAVIEDLLQYSRISRIGAEKKELINLNAVMQEVLADLEVSITQSQAKVEIPSFPGVIGNAVQLRLLFQNLLSNAIKFSKKDIPPNIRIEIIDLKDGDKEIRLSDQGIGFEEKYMEKIYQPFQRLHRKDEYEGTGIGLSIVKKIIDHHNWKISAESQLGVGATFIITVPLAALNSEKFVMERV